MSDETGESRVSMNWPNDLKEQVRERVGARGLTTFTLDAVREKLAREANKPTPIPESATPEPEPIAPEPSGVAVAPAAPSVQTVVDVDLPEEEQDERGEEIVVDAPPTLGVAARFSGSAQAVNDLLARAQALGLKKATDLATKPVLDAPAAAPVVPALTAPVVEPEVRAIPAYDLDDIDAGF